MITPLAYRETNIHSCVYINTVLASSVYLVIRCSDQPVIFFKRVYHFCVHIIELNTLSSSLILFKHWQTVFAVDWISDGSIFKRAPGCRHG